jgi:transcriptional regulator with XRE-family HTH domain
MRRLRLAWSHDTCRRFQRPGDILASSPGASTPRGRRRSRSAEQASPGLRREEVAFLAGVSSDYYVRLEQGRDKNPSDQVVLSIARALQLDDDATGYLLQLAKPSSRRRKRARKPEKASDSIRTLISGWPLTPAYVHGRYMDVLARRRAVAAQRPLPRSVGQARR